MYLTVKCNCYPLLYESISNKVLDMIDISSNNYELEAEMFTRLNLHRTQEYQTHPVRQSIHLKEYCLRRRN